MTRPHEPSNTPARYERLVKPWPWEIADLENSIRWMKEPHRNFSILNMFGDSITHLKQSHVILDTVAQLGEELWAWLYVTS